MNTIDIESRVGELMAAVQRDEISAAQAIRDVDRVLRTFRRVGLSDQEDAYNLKALLGIGESYEAVSSFDRALAVYEEALELARKFNERASEAALLRQTDRVQRKRNRWDNALHHIRESRAIYDELQDETGSARCQISEGIVDYERGNYDAASDSYQDALEVGQRIPNRRIVADATMNLGILYAIRGDFDEATVHYQNSLALFEQLDSTVSMAQAYHNLGKCFAAKGNWTQALDAYERSLEISQDQGNLMQSAM